MPPRHQVRWNRQHWVSLSPNGLGHQKPNHYWEMARTLWENRGNLPYAWRVLSRGVCDGCALGVAGFNDWTMKGPHLCAVRLNLLYLNTMGALDSALLEDVPSLQAQNSKALRKLGRLPYPFIRHRGDRGFRRISWEEAYALAVPAIRAALPDRFGIYLTSRGLTNEVYYAAQKTARFLGTNNLDNAARICHSPSTVALKQSLGVGASTCSYSDWLGTDLLILVGSNVANDQPVTTKYMYYAKQHGTRIVVVNTLREPGLERYWIPSAAESAIFGTYLADDFFLVHTGGDLAFFHGVLKALLEQGAINQDFIASHTTGFEELQHFLRALSWESLEQGSGAPRTEIERLAGMIKDARSGIIVWSMGVTQHTHGVDTVHTLINLALSQGWLGREHAGLMPIRGHSGVQGGAEMGAYATAFPGGLPVNPENAHRLEEQWGFPVPARPGLNAVELLHACGDGAIDVLWSAGGNFLETMPAPRQVEAALRRVPLRIHQDIVLTSQMLVDPAETVLLLPATTRYEQEGGGTETTTERRIIYSPEIPGHQVGEARSEWRIFMEMGERVFPERAHLLHFADGAAIRREIATVVPAYRGIEELQNTGDQVQWGGVHLCPQGVCPTADGRAAFSAVPLPEQGLAPGQFRVSTRRGKQFNSMVHSAKDPLTGATRHDILMAAADASELNLQPGQTIVLRNKWGEFTGQVRLAPMRPRNLQVHWPEGNVLISPGRSDRRSGVPDYNATVEIVVPPAAGGERADPA